LIKPEYDLGLDAPVDTPKNASSREVSTFRIIAIILSSKFPPDFGRASK